MGGSERHLCFSAPAIKGLCASGRGGRRGNSRARPILNGPPLRQIIDCPMLLAAAPALRYCAHAYETLGKAPRWWLSRPIAPRWDWGPLGQVHRSFNVHPAVLEDQQGKRRNEGAALLASWTGTSSRN